MIFDTKKVMIWLAYGFLSVLILIVFLAPYLFTLSASVRLDRHIFSTIHPITFRTFIPKWEQITFQNFVDIFKIMNFGRPLLNSVMVGIAMTSGVLILNSIAAFAFSRIDFPYKNVTFAILLSTMLLPMEVSIIPMYNVVRKLGFHNTFWALVVPWIGEPFAIFMLKQFFDGISKTLDEAAIMDGCSLFGVFRYIIIPNSRPIFITLGLIQFLNSWDGFFWPLIAVEKDSLRVIQLAVATLLDPDYIRWGWTFAAATVATLPILLLFLLLQRHYIEGISGSGIKE